MKLNSSLFYVLFISLSLLLACNADNKKEKKVLTPEELPENNLTFRDVNGIRFYEVKRRFKNGLSFNDVGFQQEPNWIIEHKAPDTMLAYSPEIQAMEAFYLHHDHGKIYNFAREFFRVKVISKDSLILQRIQVDGKMIAGDDDLRSDVYCTYYTKDYIEKKLKTTVDELRKPTPADTTFIKKLSERTHKDPSNPAFAFAARKTVEFIPTTPYITVEKQSSQDLVNQHTAAYDYIYPEYRIVILRAYKDFAYRMHVIVDANKKIYVKSVDGVLEESQEARKKMLQGVADVYLSHLLKINPGTTLGIPHSSEITINIVGRKVAK